MKVEILKIDEKPVVLESLEDGKFSISKEQLEELLEIAYQAGKKAYPIINYPNITYPTWPNGSGTKPGDDWKITWTCQSNAIDCNNSGGQING